MMRFICFVGLLCVAACWMSVGLVIGQGRSWQWVAAVGGAGFVCLAISFASYLLIAEELDEMTDRFRHSQARVVSIGTYAQTLIRASQARSNRRAA